MAVETAQVIVVSPRLPDVTGALTVPATFATRGIELVAFAGRAKINVQTHFFGTRRGIELVHMSAVSPEHPLANSISTTHIGYIGRDDIVAQLGDPFSVQVAEQRLRELGRRVKCTQREGSIISTILATSEPRDAGIVIEHL